MHAVGQWERPQLSWDSTLQMHKCGRRECGLGGGSGGDGEGEGGRGEGKEEVKCEGKEEVGGEGKE